MEDTPQATSSVETRKPPRISWYRSPVSREDLIALNKRSDLMGFLQTLGFMAVLIATGGGAVWAVYHVHWLLAVVLFFCHGTCASFLINGFHELIHDSVFRTRFLNRLFLWIFSFWGWYSFVHFWASHTEHHKYTLHPPDDGEVVLPIQIQRKAYLKRAFIDPLGLWGTLELFARWSVGRVEGDWECALFPESNVAGRRRLFNWARFVLAGHVAIVTVCLAMGWWYVPLVTTFSRFYGAWLFALCNSAQHIGLTDNVPDFRLCCRTILLDPITQFLYWHMNYHTEHHMYAAVPCYKLGKLHRLIRDDLPHCPRGLYETWTHIAEIQRKQEDDPDYQFVAELPTQPATQPVA